MSYAGPASRRKRAPILDLHRGGSSTTARSAAARGGAANASGPVGSKSFRPLPNYGRSSRNSHRGPVLAVGVAIGLVLGAGAALLFAPQSGAVTRRSLVRRTRRLGVRGHDAWDDLRLELRRLQRKAARRRAASSL